MNRTIENAYSFKRASQLDKYSPETGTCYNKNIKSTISGFSKQFQDSFFYSNVIQFLLVALMYFKVGSGKYWKILFYASIAGCIAGILENFTVAFICRDVEEFTEDVIVVPFLIDEIFWIAQQYSVPLLNLLKLKYIAKEIYARFIHFVILGLLGPFIVFRLLIGYERMMKGYLVDEKINALHGFAFGTIAIADLICSVSIIYYLKKNSKTTTNTEFKHYIKLSSYNVLLMVDTVEIFLSLINIFANTGLNLISTDLTTPFQCLMSNFILILAVDAIILKYNANIGDGKRGNSNNSINQSRNSTISPRGSFSYSVGNHISIPMNSKYVNYPSTIAATNRYSPDKESINTAPSPTYRHLSVDVTNNNRMASLPANYVAPVRYRQLSVDYISNQKSNTQINAGPSPRSRHHSIDSTSNLKRSNSMINKTYLPSVPSNLHYSFTNISICEKQNNSSPKLSKKNSFGNLHHSIIDFTNRKHSRQLSKSNKNAYHSIDILNPSVIREEESIQEKN